MPTTVSISIPASEAGEGLWRRRIIWFEAGALLLFLLLCNLTLLGGTWSESYAFVPAKVAGGEWWRLLTHPFVHVSKYHLLLDGSAFFLLYTELRHWPATRRFAALAACVMGSVLGAMTSPLIFTRGLCGLSGVAHGLMIFSALEMIRRGERWERLFGWVALACVVVKAGMEAATGHVVLWFLHGASVGVPIAACHTGGVIGALVFALFVSKPWRNGVSNNSPAVGNP